MLKTTISLLVVSLSVLSACEITVELKPGVSIIGLEDADYESFMGIPYAESPVGDLRFAAPQEKDLWTGDPHNGTFQRSPCVQKNILFPGLPVVGSEDCLHLNIYRPVASKRTDEAMPVLFYIHGGGFFFGDSNPGVLGPRYIMQQYEHQRVVVVVIQYRLSALGFFSTGDSACPGNNGFKDQRAAMRWVKKNIQYFGGSPTDVTIAGQSAGGASVHLHMLSPNSKSLFHKAIAMSGSALGPYIYPTKDPLALAKRHATVLNIDPNLTTNELMMQMREASASDIIETVEKLKFFDIDPLTIYRLVLEPEAQDAFMTQEPRAIQESGNYQSVPFLASLVNVEGAIRAAAFVVNENLKEQLNSRMKELLPDLMELEATGDTRENFTTRILERYLPGTHKLTEENEQQFIQMYTDRSFKYPFYKQMQLMSKHSTKIYSYYFAFRGTHSYSPFFTAFNPRDFGVVHCDDLIYLFESTALQFNLPHELDRIASRLLVKTILDFMKGTLEKKTVLNDSALARQYVFKGSIAEEEIATAEGNYDISDLVRFWDQAQEFN